MTPESHDEQNRKASPVTGSAQDRLTLTNAFDTASINGVSMALGRWAGRGDWATFTADFRDQAGPKALTELDQMINRLITVRGQLADVVQPKPAYGPFVYPELEVGLVEPGTDDAHCERCDVQAIVYVLDTSHSQRFSCRDCLGVIALALIRNEPIFHRSRRPR